MYKVELEEAIAERVGIPKRQSRRVLEATLETIIDALESGESVKLSGFGSFEVMTRAGRKGRNLQTGAEIDIPPVRTVVFKPGKTLKRIVAGQS